MSSGLIQPKILKGFRDSLPEQEIEKQHIIRVLEDTFRSFGFLPIDTPVLEYTEILLGKGGGDTDKQVYRFLDHGERDVSMRFDLTVPFARFMAQHVNELYLPFKRYHVSKVWRGENTQRGRYREFFQCDFDIVGADSISADIEILLMMKRSLETIGIDNFSISLSNRELFNRFLDFLDVSDQSVPILRTIDKVQKIGEEKVLELLLEFIDKETGEKILAFIRSTGNWENDIKSCEDLSGGPSEESEYIKSLFGMFRELGVEELYKFDPSITRGLDYYTGVVFETFLNDLPKIGSVCSGGRYNNLASLYTKEQIPGVGASIGLDRLLSALEQLGKKNQTTAGADVLIFLLESPLLPHYHRIGEIFRDRGIAAEVYPIDKKLSAQFQYAEKKKIPFGIICGGEERENNSVNLKNLNTRESFNGISLERAIEIVSDTVQ